MAKVGPFLYWRRMATRQFVKRVLRRGLEMTLPNGSTVYLPAHSGFSSVAWVTRGAVDDGFEELLRELGKPGTAFFDVGAHFGFYCVFLCDRHAPVVAFEPDARTIPFLQRNLAGIEGSVCVAAAASDHSGKVQFSACHSSPQSRVLSSESDQTSSKVLTVDATTLDDTWRRLGEMQVGVMKIDTEGHEIAVLAGAREMIETCQPLMLIEATFRNLSPHCDWLGRLGYVAIVLSPRLHGQSQVVSVVQLDELEPAFDEGMILLVSQQTRECPAWKELAAGRLKFALSPANSTSRR